MEEQHIADINESDVLLNFSKVKPNRSAIAEKVLMVVNSVIDEINHQLPKKRRLDKNEDTVIYRNAKDRNLDSLGIVNLIVETEQKLFEEFELEINLTNQQIITENRNPLSTIKSFTDFVTEVLEIRLSG